MPAGWPSRLTSPSRKADPAQLCRGPLRSLGTQLYQNSSFAPWCWRTTSRYARSTLVGNVNVRASAFDSLERGTVPPVALAESGSTTSAVRGPRSSSSSSG